MNDYQQRIREYEQEKQLLRQRGLSPEEYEAELKAAAERCGV